MPQRLMCVHRGFQSDKDNDQHLYWTTYNPQTQTWNADTVFSNDNKSASAPALALYKDTVFCAHRGKEGNENLWWTTFDVNTRTWATDRLFEADNKSSDAPALAVLDGTLYCVHRGVKGDPSLYWTTFDPRTKQWAVDTRFTHGNLADNGPALAVHNGVLYCVHQGHGDYRLWWTTFEPVSGTWAPDAMVNNDLYAACGPGLADYNGTLYCMNRGHVPEGSPSNLSWVTLTSNAWTQPMQLSQGNKSNETPALVSYGGALWCVHPGGNDQGLWWTKFNGSNWDPDTEFPDDNRSYVGLALIGVSFP